MVGAGRAPRRLHRPGDRPAAGARRVDLGRPRPDRGRRTGRAVRRRRGRRATCSPRPPRTRRSSSSSTTSSGSTCRRGSCWRTSPTSSTSSGSAMLAGRRRGSDAELDLGRTIEMRGLPTDVAEQLLTDAGVSSADVRRRLLAAAGGNPLVLVEAANLLEPAERAGRAVLPDPAADRPQRPADGRARARARRSRAAQRAGGRRRRPRRRPGSGSPPPSRRSGQGRRRSTRRRRRAW